METTQSVAEYLLVVAAKFRAGKLKAIAMGMSMDACYCDAAAIAFEILAEKAKLQGWIATNQGAQPT